MFGGQDLIQFSKERMCFCFSDIQDHNFIFTNSDQGFLYVVDFEHAAFLPISFMAFVLDQSPSWLADAIRERIGLPKSEMDDNTNLVHMGWVRYYFGLYADGLGEYRYTIRYLISFRSY